MTARNSPKRRAGSLRRRETRAAYLFLAIPLVLFSLFKIYPMLSNLYLSFTRYDMFSQPQLVGVSNYLEALQDKVFWAAVRNTVVYGLAVVLAIMALSLLVAIALNKRLPGVIIFRSSFYAPSVISIVVVSMIWMWLYQPQAGLINYVLDRIGFEPQFWLDNPRLALPSVIIVTIWQQLGYNMIIFLAGLQGIPDFLYEAATIDGAGRWSRFRYVTIPSLKPIFLFVIVTTFIFVFRNFPIIFIMTEGGPFNATNTLVYEVYRNSFNYSRGGYGAVFAVVLLSICLVFSLINLRLLRTE
jgi:ABC-type sugar transport system permease subunit